MDYCKKDYSTSSGLMVRGTSKPRFVIHDQCIIGMASLNVDVERHSLALPHAYG